MDTETVRNSVHEVILEIVRERNPKVESVDDTQHLNSQLDLKSLDLAQIVAMLEAKLGGDPFEELVPITSMRTVGDVVEAYCSFFRGDRPQASALSDARERAARRLSDPRRRDG